MNEDQIREEPQFNTSSKDQRSNLERFRESVQNEPGMDKAKIVKPNGQTPLAEKALSRPIL